MKNEGRIIDESQAASVKGADSVFRAVCTRVQVLAHLGQVCAAPRMERSLQIEGCSKTGKVFCIQHSTRWRASAGYARVSQSRS
jgi:hypothetical protein